MHIVAAKFFFFFFFFFFFATKTAAAGSGRGNCQNRGGVTYGDGNPPPPPPPPLSFGGGDYGNRQYGGGETNWAGAGHTPSFSYPRPATARPNFTPGAQRPNSMERFNGTARPNININNINPSRVANLDNVNRGESNRSWANYRPDWYHGDWHGNWNHPWYNRPAAWWTAGYVTGAALATATPWNWGYWSYYNPYRPARS